MEQLKKSRIIHVGMWQIPIKCLHALCEDGKQRTARITAQSPDTFFSIPASVQYKGKTVSGFLTWDKDKEVDKFIAYSYRRNGHLLKESNN